ncbi:MAG: 2-polyprenyl-3-methyl-5-hydroxy-6-metoxy-1 4-ben zoquinolmethylase [Spirochaetes bacterium]|nr:MAG: 2-polyprenyl-3-methyl-5-hydroxy-6-metoxy-1 4-ben zoquinolmethylase [Spirochaetota bacterium]
MNPGEVRRTRPCRLCGAKAPSFEFLKRESGGGIGNARTVAYYSLTHGTLDTLVPRLGPGGIFAIRTRFPPQEEARFAAWWYRMDPTHVSFYSPESLGRFLGNRGFDLVARFEPDCLVFRMIAT